MHITKLEIKNIRALEHFTIELTPEEAPGWHVIIGSNSSGKSTVIRSIALALIGPLDARVLRENWRNWLRNGKERGEISITVTPYEEDFVEYETSEEALYGDAEDFSALVKFKDFPADEKRPRRVLIGTPRRDNPIWNENSVRFASSFGAFRRISTDDGRFGKIFEASPRVAPHLSAFGEDIPLSAGLALIQTLHVRNLEGDKSAGRLMEKIKAFVNETKLLPFGARITDVTSEHVTLLDGEDNEVDIQQMSSGYKAILSTIFEIINQMVYIYGEDKVAKAINLKKGGIDIPGIVSIDEVDAHLHPSWQRDIGHWFTQRFPNIQFFVTTHSPIICRAAKSVWKLPNPGTGEAAERVSGPALNRLIYGSILDAYGTELFGADVAQSDEGRKAREELSRLNRKSLNRRLSERDAMRMTELRAMLPSRASDTAPE
ncbi:AAA family ATPase [Azospirillum isscasi]|uniref:ATP-binding protein n=1 Tax=Azospirillum isscasi TaxID=3053926 RepID=A0ABU0WMR7_9PROT|nr:ATP-binding protein [Azospirillum isscasi]MDQ2105524.1 ATP-binding protein [Azospirillum isscasi]